MIAGHSNTAHAVEALGGTLKAAKKRKLINYDSELLLQGVQLHAPDVGTCHMLLADTFLMHRLLKRLSKSAGAHDDVEVYIMDQQTVPAATESVAEPAAAHDAMEAPVADGVPEVASASEVQPDADASGIPAST